MAEDQSQTLSFIEEYRSFQLLWDNNHKDYTNKIKRNDALDEISKKCNMDTAAVKLKIKSLRSYFSKERQKVLKKKSGSGTDENYTSSWFAYKSLLFISDATTPRETKESEKDDNPASLNNNEEDVQDELPCGNGNISNQSHPVIEEHEFIQPIRTKRDLKRNNRDEREDEAYKLMKRAADEIERRDEWSTFGTFVADNIRKLKPLNQILAKREVTNMLFDLQMKEIETSGRQSSLPPESPATSVDTCESDSHSFTYDDSTGLMVNTANHPTTHELNEYLSFRTRNDE